MFHLLPQVSWPCYYMLLLQIVSDSVIVSISRFPEVLVLSCRVKFGKWTLISVMIELYFGTICCQRSDTQIRKPYWFLLKDSSIYHLDRLRGFVVDNWPPRFSGSKEINAEYCTQMEVRSLDTCWHTCWHFPIAYMTYDIHVLKKSPMAIFQLFHCCCGYCMHAQCRLKLEQEATTTCCRCYFIAEMMHQNRLLRKTFDCCHSIHPIL